MRRRHLATRNCASDFDESQSLEQRLTVSVKTMNGKLDDETEKEL